MVGLQTLSLGLLLSQALAIPATQSYETSTASLPTAASSETDTASSQLDQLASFAYNVTADSFGDDSKAKRGGCSLQTLRIRRDWRTFSSKQKKSYIDSILCLQKLPANTPENVAAGAKSRYDDFLATHIDQTLKIHYTGTFLAWHRYFVFEFEQALRNECGYTGDYPYWNWPADAHALEQSPVFDGSETSLSGNGEPIPNQADVELHLGDAPTVYLPAGSGGGCVTSGPFKDYTVNMGPAALSLPGGNMSMVSKPLNYNPRCLKRDLTTALIQKYANYTSVVDLILRNNDIYSFQTTMQGVPGSGSIGVHGGGHYSMGGDPGRDVYTSPGDPAFWLHHGMIDRVWWIWQSLDIKNRRDAISGTGTFMNNPASPNTTLETEIDVGYAGGGEIQMRELMSTTDGAFCYIYV